MKNLTVWVDLEVTDFNSTKGALTQVSLIVERDNKEIDRFNAYINPFSLDSRTPTISIANLKRSNRTIQEVKAYPSYSDQFKKLEIFLLKHLRENELYQIAGHNVAKHDYYFMQQFFRDNNKEETFPKLFSYATIDTLQLARILRHQGLLDKCEDDKLGSLCQFFNVKLDSWHNSESDIESTNKLYIKLIEYLRS